mmetsp:Transcript_46271/g.110089  ORF Transcript_46271/g.110089 Transcript_46271/m.110089 type:complete len:888 (-) Transcript_46271:48-2711(-)
MQFGTCWSRPKQEVDDRPLDPCLTDLLKVTRDQLDKKSRISDDLAKEVRRLEADLLDRSKQHQELKDVLSANKAELRAAAKVSANERSQFVEERAKLQDRSDKAIALATSMEKKEAEAQSAVEALRLQLEQQEAATKAAVAAASDSHEVKWVQERVTWAEQLTAESSEVSKLRAALQRSEEAQDVAALRAANDARTSQAAEASARESQRDSAAEAESLRKTLEAVRAELHAQAKEHQEELAGLNMQSARLRAEAAREVSEALQRGEEMQAKMAAAGTPTMKAEAASPSISLAAAERIAALETQLEELRKEVAAAKDREAKMQTQLDQERELHDEAVRQLQVMRKESSANAQMLRQELEQLSGAMEEKEEEIMDISFSFAELQNRLRDQVKLVGENADAFQTAAEELAEKDEKLTKVQEEQEAMVANIATMNEMSEKLQARIQALSKDLENSKSCQEQTDTILKKMEADRDSLATELQRVRSEHAAELDDLREERAKMQAAASVLSEELRNSKAYNASLDEVWEARLGQATVLADARIREVQMQAECREAELREELRSSSTRHAHSAQQAAERERLLVLESNAHAAAAQEWSRELAQAMQNASQEKAILEDELSEVRASADRMAAEMQHFSGAAPDMGPDGQSVTGSVQHSPHTEALLKQKMDEVEKLRGLMQIQSQKLRTDTQELNALIGVERERACQLSTKLAETQDLLASATERLHTSEAQVIDLAAALDRSRLLERQALERAQDYNSSLQLLREFGHEDFMAAAPRAESMPEEELPREDTKSQGATLDAELRPAVSPVLMAVELELGVKTDKAGGGRKATLTIAPWQTRADFDSVVQEFLQEHRVRAVFAASLVRYLEQLEAQAATFPVTASGNLCDIYNQYFQ